MRLTQVCVFRGLLLYCFVGLLFFSNSVSGQQTQVTKDAPEFSQTDIVPTFKVRVNQVLMRVVVRDSNGKSVAGINREDFLLLDNGKVQPITSFAETKNAESMATPAALKTEASGTQEEADASKPPKFPARFIILLFDDIHLKANDLPVARAAADEWIDHSLEPWERAAVLSTSGLVTQQFTNDHAALHAALKRLMPGSVRRESDSDCPYMNYYLANVLENGHDSTTMNAAIRQTIECAHLEASPNPEIIAKSMVEQTALAVLGETEIDRKVLLSTLQASIREAGSRAGRREIVFVSPGFFALEDHDDLTGVLEEALRMGVVINVLDSRGLWTDRIYDASEHQVQTSQSRHVLEQIDHRAELSRSDASAEIADTTGGKFFHNNNDLTSGMRQLASEPESAYMLAFTPENLRSDGKFHALKVKLSNRQKYEISARKGYYAPPKQTDPEEAAKQEMEDEFYSQEEIQGIPLDVHTQYFKSTENSANLSVIVRFAPSALHFRKENDLNIDSVTEICGVFDSNGQFVSGVQKLINLRLRNATLDSLRSGIAVKNALDVKPGAYLVRVVLRDKEGQTISARSIAVEIP